MKNIHNTVDFAGTYIVFTFFRLDSARLHTKWNQHLTTVKPSNEQPPCVLEYFQTLNSGP